MNDNSKNEESAISIIPQKKENLIIMKKGDYSVHVLIEEIKNLPQIKGDQLPFPTVKIKCFGKTQRTTKTKISCTSYTFNEHFYFDKTNLTQEMLDSEKIIIEAYDSKHSKKEDYFGIYEFDFEYIYNNPDHAIHNFWLALANPESKDITKIGGYLKLSISVLHENDSRIELENKESENSNCLIPAQIKMEYKLVAIHIFRGEEFPDMDSLIFDKKINRECDGYIEVSYMGIKRKTKVVAMKKEICEWNQIIEIPVSVPSVSQKLVMVVKDKDPTIDDIVGSLELNIDDILKGKYSNLQYFNIYGSPLNKHGKIYDMMNYNAEIGSKWKGRVLLKFVVSNVDAPAVKVSDITDKEYLKDVYSKGRPNQWSVHFKIYETLYLPEQHNHYGLRISLQENTKLFPSRKSVNRNIEWNVAGTLQCLTLSDDKENLPDVFIYITDKKGENNICFQRIKASHFYLSRDIFVIKLLPDPAIGKVENMMQSGIIKMKICVVNTKVDKEFDVSEFTNPHFHNAQLINSNNNPEVEDLEEMFGRESRISMNPNAKNYTIVAIIYMSKGLIAADSNGTSDPFVTLSLGTKTLKTTIRSSTINGIWNETVEFDNISMDIADSSTWPIFLLTVMDYNKILSNVAIGYNYVMLCDSSYTLNSKDLIRPKWHDLYLPKSNKKQGQIMLAFYLFDEEHLQLKNDIDFLPKTIPYSCEINVLGLRDLKPLSMLPVKKPFIKFDMNSLNVTGKAEDCLQTITTIPGDTGSNPTINAVIKFDARLPEEEIFIPELQCEVYDHLLSGMYNSLLGVFSLDIKKLIKKTNKQINEDLLEIDKKKDLFISSEDIQDKYKPLNYEEKNKQFKNEKLIEDDFENNNIENVEEKLDEDNENIKINNEELEENDENIISTNKKKNTNRNSKNKQMPNKERRSDSNISDNQVMDIANSIMMEQEAEMSKIEKEDEIDTTSENTKNKKNIIPLPGKTKIQSDFVLSKEYIKANLHDSSLFVIYPKFTNFIVPSNSRNSNTQKEFLIEDLSKAPDKELFFSVGYILRTKQIPKKEEYTKHYRRIYRQPLENIKELKLKSPFNKAKIRRGKYIDKKNEIGLFDAMRNMESKILSQFSADPLNTISINNIRQTISSVTSGPSQEGFMGNNTDENEKEYGKFKGVIRICEKQKMEMYNKKIAEAVEKAGPISTNFKNFDKYEELRKRILAKRNVIVRIYILELLNLAKKDLFSESDPYVIISLNNKDIINERKNHQDDMKNCKWYKYYDLPCELPGTSQLKISIWDYDDLMLDSLIGYTKIDLEDRYFDNTWQELKEKPIEVRPLLHDDIKGSQGEIYLWLEIFDAEERNNHNPIAIEPEPITDLELRLVVWETEEIELMDIEGTSDIYIIAYIEQKEKQTTDVHYRCQTGCGSFNWRMLLPIHTPTSPNKLTIQVYDNDIFSSDDFICGAEINLQNLIVIPKNLDMPIKFNRQYFNSLPANERKEFYSNIRFEDSGYDTEGIKFWVKCRKSNGEESGSVLLSMEILPKWKANMEKVGKGRDEPNFGPYCPPPVGRITFSLNPFTNLNQCVGPKFRRKIYCWICCFLICAYLLFAIPYIIYHVAGEIANPFNYLK